MHICSVKSPFHTLEVAKWTKMGRKYMCVVEKLTTALFCIMIGLRILIMHKIILFY